MKRPLSKRQRAILDFIIDYIARHVRPPTLREIGNHFGIRSTNGVNDHLRALEQKGYITKDAMLSRSIRVVDEPPSEGDETSPIGTCRHCGSVIIKRAS